MKQLSLKNVWFRKKLSEHFRSVYQFIARYAKAQPSDQASSYRLVLLIKYNKASRKTIIETLKNM